MKSTLRLFSTVCVLVGIAISSPAATLTWLGGAGDWADPTKWDGGTVPGPNDIVIINSGTVTADWESTIAGLTITGGILEGIGQIHITGPFNWSGGTMRGSGQTILEATGSGTISGAADKDLERLIENKGALTWNQGRLVYRNGTFVNSGDMTIAHNGELVSGANIAIFDNAGTLHKTSAGQAHFNSIVFNNTGVVDFAAGTLFLAGGGSNTKTIAVPAGGVLRFSRTFSHPVGSALTGPGAVHFEGGTHVIDGAYTVAGLTSIRGGTVNYPNEVSLPSAELSTGRLEGAGTVHLTGTASWTGGTMAGAGKTILETGATMTISGAADKDLSRAFENKGTVTWDNGRLVYRDGTFLNEGEMTIAHNGDLVNGATTAIFDNVGTLHKTSSGQAHFNSVVFNNTGVVDFAAGTLFLAGGGSNTKTISVPAGGLLRFSRTFSHLLGSTLTGAGAVHFEGGTHVMEGAYTVAGLTSIRGGTVNYPNEVSLPSAELSTGRLDGAGTVHLTGTASWTGGTMAGAGKTILETGATMTISGAADKDLSRAFENKGTVTWDNGRVVYRDGTFLNAGEMTIAHNGDLVNGATTAIFDNVGTLHKTSSGQAHFNSVVFNNTGEVDFAAGTLFLAGGGSNTKTIAVPTGGVLRFSRTFSHLLGSTLTGAGAVHFEGGTHVMEGAYTVAGLTSIRGGTVNYPNEVSLPSAELSTGRLEGAGTVHLTGTASWTGGTMAGAGKTIVETGATMTMSGGADKDLSRAFENKGSVTWDNGRIVYRDGTFLNAGDMTIAHDGDLVNGATTAIFDNTGTLHKTSSGQAHFNSVVFNNTGEVDFAAGTLFLAGGGSNTKTIAVPTGGVLRFSRTFSHPVGSTLTGPGAVHFEGGSHLMDGAYTVAGLTSIRGGTVNYPNEVSLPSAELSTGRLEGAGTVHLTGTAIWTGGTMAGAGKTILETGATMTISGSADKDLSRAFENKGTVTWDNGRIVYRDGTLLNGGELTIAHNGELVNGATTAIFDNVGTLHKTSAGQAHFNSVVFNNTGVVDFAAGTLFLAGGGRNATTIAVPAGGVLRFSRAFSHPVGSTLTGAGNVNFEGGFHALEGAYTVTGLTTVNGGTVDAVADVTLPNATISSGIVEGAGTLRLTGAFTWSGGMMRGLGKTIIEANGTATFTGGADKDLSRDLENRGVIDWTQGRLVFRNATLVNIGVMNIAATQDAVNGATTATLENRGALNKTSGGVMAFSGVLLKQNGTMHAIGTTGVSANRFEQNGVFSPGLAGAGTAAVTGNFPQSSDGTMLIELAGDNAYDQLKVSGVATLRGDLKIALVGGYVPAEGTTFTPLEFGSRVGAFDALVGLNLSSTLMLEPTFSGTNLVFTVKARPVPIFSNSRVERPSGLPIFTISGIAGQTFVLEARDSFEPGTSWTDVLTSADSSVIYEFIDQDRANHSTRFFRARRVD